VHFRENHVILMHFRETRTNLIILMQNVILLLS
jgi:hypothetical protein